PPVPPPPYPRAGTSPPAPPPNPRAAARPRHDASAANTTRCPRCRSTFPMPMQLFVGPNALSGMNRTVSGLPAIAAPHRKITENPNVAERATGTGPDQVERVRHAMVTQTAYATWLAGGHRRAPRPANGATQS